MTIASSLRLGSPMAALSPLSASTDSTQLLLSILIPQGLRPIGFLSLPLCGTNSNITNLQERERNGSEQSRRRRSGPVRY